MAKTAYHIQLKGYVGGADFDRASVDSTLAEYPEERVNVLIDSLGGSLATGMSISSSFRNHGNVNVHFVGLNASAATIASLGAAHISIDAGAMYLVHKCSIDFFRWASMNADQFSKLIDDCEKVMEDLNKLDQNCARLYAARCRRKPEDLLALMKKGGWLTAQEALDWGFVDEITDLDDEASPGLTDALASALTSAGIPIPNIPVSNPLGNGAMAGLMNAISSFFRNISNRFPMDKDTPAPDQTTDPTSETYTAEQYNDLNRQLDEQKALVADRDRTISDLEAKLAKKPAESSSQVVEDSASADDPDKSDFDRFCSMVKAATSLYNEV